MRAAGQASALVAYVLVALFSCAQAQISPHVSCVNRTANLETEIRETCCKPMDDCRRYSFGAPKQVKRAPLLSPSGDSDLCPPPCSVRWSVRGLWYPFFPTVATCTGRRSR